MTTNFNYVEVLEMEERKQQLSLIKSGVEYRKMRADLVREFSEEDVIRIEREALSGVRHGNK